VFKAEELEAKVRNVLRTSIAKLTSRQDPDSVAKLLAAMGIRGVRYHTEACALACYFRRELCEAGITHYADVCVSVTEREIVVDLQALDLDQIQVPTPPVLGAFVLRFDNGDYPDITQRNPVEEGVGV